MIENICTAVLRDGSKLYQHFKNLFSFHVILVGSKRKTEEKVGQSALTVGGIILQTKFLNLLLVLM